MATYKPDNYSRADAAVSQITEEVNNILSNLERGVQTIRDAESRLLSLAQGTPVGWSDAVVYVNKQHSDDPTDPEWKALRGRLGKVVTDFQSERKKVTRLIRKIDALDVAGGG